MTEQSETRPNRYGLPGSRRARIGAAIALAFAAFLILAFCVTRVGAAEVGIRVSLAGSARGVDDIPVVTGWVLYNPLVEQVIVFPTSVLTTVWTQVAHEGSPTDESITFSSREGVNVNADIAISFHIDPARAPHLYLRFRKTRLEDLADGYVRSAVREAFNIAASKRPVESIYGAGKEEMLAETKKLLSDKLAPDGFVIDQLTFNAGLRLPDNVTAAINRAMEATQLAVQAENRVRQVRAEAEQAVTLAEGQASAARARAKGEGDSRLIKAKAEARANQMLQSSMSARVLQYRALERWNGKLPVMNGAGKLPIPTLDVGELTAGGAEGESRLEGLFGGQDGEEPPAPPAKAEK